MTSSGDTASAAEPGGSIPTGLSAVNARAYGGLPVDAHRGQRDDFQILWRIVRLAMQHRGRVAIAVAATLAAAAFQLLIPQLLGDAVDSALGLLNAASAPPAVAREALFSAALLLLGVSVLRGLFTLAHNYSGEAIGHQLAYDLRLAFYDKLQRLSFSFHDRVHTGELITRGMLDLEGVRMFFNTGVLRVLLLCILIGAGAWLLMSADLVLGALSLSFVPFVAWNAATIRLRLRHLWLSLQDRLAVLSRIMDENLTGIRVVRAFGAEHHELNKYDSASDEALALSDRRIRLRVASTCTMTFAYFVAMGLVLWVGGLRVLDGTITVGKLTEFLAFMTILQQPVRQLGMVVNAFARASTCGSRLFAVLDFESEIAEPGTKNDKGFFEVQHPTDQSVMVHIPAGEFTMGSDQYSAEKPVQKISLNDYYIDKFLVTNAQFQKYVDATEYKTDAEKDGTGLVRVGRRWKKVEGANWRSPDGVPCTVPC